MNLFLAWLTVIVGIVYEAWQAANAIAKDRTKSVDRYY